MNAATTWLLVVTFPAWFVSFAAWLWTAFRLEAHMRRNHPVLAESMFPPVPHSSRPAMDDEQVIQIEGHARHRLREFITSGATKTLCDPQLDRLLLARKILRWTMHGCFAAFVVLGLYVSFRA